MACAVCMNYEKSCVLASIIHIRAYSFIEKKSVCDSKYDGSYHTIIMKKVQYTIRLDYDTVVTRISNGNLVAVVVVLTVNVLAVNEARNGANRK
jgi:hypothetical protein